MVFYEGPGSDDNYAQTMYGNTNPNAVNAAGVDNPGSVGDYFDRNPGTTAAAQFNGNRVYINPRAVNSTSLENLVYTVMHEALHNISGLNGDQNLQAKLGITVGAPSINITNELKERCPAPWK